MKRFLGWLATLALVANLFVMPLTVMAEDDTSDTNTIDLNANGSDINDTDSFDVGNILTTTGQDTDQYLDLDTDQPVAAIILSIINFITLVIGSIAMLLIILGGLLMIVSEGDENRLQRGKDILTSAIIGLVIAMASYLIVTFVQSIFY